MKPNSRCGVTLRRGNDYRGGPAFRAGAASERVSVSNSPAEGQVARRAGGLRPRCERPVEKDPPTPGASPVLAAGAHLGKEGTLASTCVDYGPYLGSSHSCTGTADMPHARWFASCGPSPWYLTHALSCAASTTV